MALVINEFLVKATFFLDHTAGSMDGITDEASYHHSPILKLLSETESENVCYSAMYEDLPDEFRLMAEQELEETGEKRRNTMQQLKEFMKSRNMHSFKDIYLLAILRCCKYNLKNAKVKLKKFAVTYRVIADMAAKLDFSKVEYILDDMCFGFIPYRDKYGRAIFYTRPYGFDEDKYTVEDLGTVIIVSVLFLLTFPITTVAGVVYFADCRSPNLSIFYQIFKIFKGLSLLYLSLPIRFKKMEIIDSFNLIRWFVKVSSVFVPEKIMKRLVFHTSSFDNLHKDYDRNMLPEVYGGNLGPLTNKIYKHKFLEFFKDLKTEYQEISS